MSGIEDYVKEVIETQDHAEIQEAMMVRFSLSLEDHQSRRLDYIAKRMGLSKTEIIRSATELVLQEFEKQLGLDLMDPDYNEIAFPPGVREVVSEDGKWHGTVEYPPKRKKEVNK